MKVQRVDRIYLTPISVAFEGEVLTLLCIIQVVNANPSLYRSHLDFKNRDEKRRMQTQLYFYKKGNERTWFNIQ